MPSEKNAGALRFYARHGFVPTGARQLEEGTPEYLIQLKYQQPLQEVRA